MHPYWFWKHMNDTGEIAVLFQVFSQKLKPDAGINALAT